MVLAETLLFPATTAGRRRAIDSDGCVGADAKARCDGSCFFRGHCVGKGEVECCCLLEFSVTSRVEERSKLMLSSWLELVRWHASAMAHQQCRLEMTALKAEVGTAMREL
ncbi:hypothetical protein OPV22_010461 [Ensete ventricosum]|uniref:Uncharacterized protein n=1 Tax=Ensete ventricosum TaxID=4639 RepID=A0AAV8RD55_ENSVE|nr:hypothetical protein OPV22_010461 [Ensete ventricosum]